MGSRGASSGRVKKVISVKGKKEAVKTGPTRIIKKRAKKLEKRVIKY